MSSISAAISSQALSYLSLEALFARRYFDADRISTAIAVKLARAWESNEFKVDALKMSEGAAIPKLRETAEYIPANRVKKRPGTW